MASSRGHVFNLYSSGSESESDGAFFSEFNDTQDESDNKQQDTEAREHRIECIGRRFIHAEYVHGDTVDAVGRVSAIEKEYSMQEYRYVERQQHD